ncbi:protein DDI1 homolog 2-like isoform X1 [Amphibalanus amphitrite]|uniref:protein DDI1 homolog 2-like isoform X1 n=2 Tax=Amphibalanus amphitrite TaxID=1232801 RepID=UPI001C90023E|nr:protein DDI1 homolog 2-like isoform X1 [Amphibalanus amphitrite]XP_043212060.1 protein DDI1 homolog 2-like isoform X1 [Amphibalanus amphitrite]XP_043212061.1 protein DDI1 homolog 2-like isoform X1 [Amphibalanus amphitrite]
MRLTITTVSGELFQLDVSEDLEVENLKAFVQVEANVPLEGMQLVHAGRRLTDDKQTLKQLGIADNDVLLVNSAMAEPAVPHSGAAALGRPQQPSVAEQLAQIDFGSICLPGMSPTGAGQPGPNREDDPAFIRDMFLANPDQLAMLKQNNPRLSDALLSGDVGQFAAVLREQQEAHSERERLRLRMLTADPFDVEAQRLMAEEIRQSNIEANMEAAMEHHPESFGTVVMLYINCRVNGFPVKAFIDSGAQTTLMSSACAERCHIMRLVDTRWSGVAKGVGTQRILGRVHMGQIQIEDVFLTSSFSILEEQPMDMLLGLDMLKRHQCVIDLRGNVLRIGTTNTTTPFLPESELPPCARLSNRSEEEARADSMREAEDAELAQAMRESSAAASSAPAATPSASAAPSGVPSAVIRPVTGGTHGSASAAAPIPATAPVAPTPTPTPVQTQTPAQTASPAVVLSIQSTDSFTEKDVEMIIGAGFSRAEAFAELRRCGGDATRAVAALFVRSFKLPK